MTALDNLKAFNIDASEVTLWTFKKQSPRDAPPKFNGHWADTTDEMNRELKNIISQQRDVITEIKEYGLLADNNEASALLIPIEETHGEILKEQFAAELPQRKIRDVRTLQNCVFYVIKLTHGDQILFSVCKTDATWKSKTAASVLTAFFSDAQLDLAHDHDFRIKKIVDFFGIDGNLLIRNKKNFESILNYRDAHERDYAEMAAEQEFVSVFDDLQELTTFVGNNKIHLRRMSAIRQKGFYLDKKFMENLRNRHTEFGLNIQFDDQRRIIPTAETCRDIIAALLDHRLSSGFSGNIYDVPDATKV